MPKIPTRITCTLVVFLSLSILSSDATLVDKKKAAPPARTFTDVIDEVQHSVCQVVVAASEHDLIGQVLGSCFFINDDGYLITSAHVVKELTSRALAGRAAIGWPLFAPDPSKTIPLTDDGRAGIIGSMRAKFTQVAIDEDVDIAVLHADLAQVKASVKPHFLKLRFHPVSPGFEVAVTGFPLYEDYPVTMTTSIASQRRMGPPESQALLNPNLTPKVPFYLLDKPLFHGFSGSPVYSRQNGEVIGIATSFRPDTVTTVDQRTSVYAALGQAIDLVWVRSVLNANHVSFSTSGPEN